MGRQILHIHTYNTKKSTHSVRWLFTDGITSIFRFIAISGIDCDGYNSHFCQQCQFPPRCNFNCVVVFSVSLFKRVNKRKVWRDPIFLRQRIFRVSFFSLSLFFLFYLGQVLFRCFCSVWNYFYPVFELRLAGEKKWNKKRKIHI